MLRRENSAKEMAEQYAGPGKSFQVKFLGSDSVSNATGDSAAADCMKRLRQAHKRAKVQLPKVTITLQFKGLTVFDERSKTVTLRVPVEKITYVCHDPETASVFAVLVKSEDADPAAKHKLFAFKTDQKTAVSFVRSARELFQLMYKLMKAKKQQLEASSSLPEEERQPDSNEELVSAPGVTMTTISPPPPPYEDTMQEWSSLDKELKQIAKDLGMEKDTPSSQLQPDPSLQLTSFDTPLNEDPFLDTFFQKSFTSPAALPSDSSSSPFASFSNTTPGSTSGQQPTINLFTSTPEGQRAPPLVQPLQPQTAQQGVSLVLDPFQASSGASDPFQVSSGVSDPFQASSGVSDPFQASSGVSDPFQASSGVSDPFQASSGVNNLFQASSGVSDPFPASSGMSDPFQTSSDSFQASSRMRDPFQTSSRMNDLFQSSSGMASNFSLNQPQQYQGLPSPANSYNVSSDSTLELSNPLYQSQDTSSYTAFSGHLQPSSQQMVHDPFGFEVRAPAQHSFERFPPQIQAAPAPGPSSFSTGPPSNFMVPANNPFASDFDSSHLFSMPQSTFSQSTSSFGHPPGSISGTANVSQDLFAELIPLAVGASPSRKVSAPKQQASKLQQETPTEFGTIQFEDIKVERSKKTVEQTQPDEPPLILYEPKVEKRNRNSDVGDDSYRGSSDQQKVLDEIFQEPCDKPSSHEQLLKMANEDTSQEPLHKDSSTFSDFETAFASADSENDKRNISEAFESPTNVAPAPSLMFETGFNDDFVAGNADAASNTQAKPSGSNGDDFWGGKTEQTATSWIAFS